MEITDFSRSFLTFRIDRQKREGKTQSHKARYTLNNARIQLESVCTISELQGDYHERFVHGASCKTERVGVEADIWTEPNADFVPVFGATHFLCIKTFDQAGKQVSFYPPSLGMQPERQIESIAGAFDQVPIVVATADGEPLVTAEQVVETVFAGRPVVARTTIENERYRAVIEYPVKTINVNERDWVYQTDTGPTLYPDLQVEPEGMISGFQLAFSAFNCTDWIEFIVRAPTAIGDEVEVYHYSKPVRWEAHNELIGLK